MSSQDEQINQRIFQLRTLKYQDGPYREEIAKDILAEFDVRLTPQAVKRRYQRFVKKLKELKTEEPTVEKDEITVNLTGNTGEISYVGGMIQTVDELLDACKIDKKEWNVDTQRVKTWPMQRKGGYLEQGFSIAAALTKKNIKARWPLITPVKLNGNFKRIEVPAREGVKTCVILADAHIAFSIDHRGNMVAMHDDRALDIAVQIIAKIQPGIIIIAGDWLDLPEWSDRFIRTPEMSRGTRSAFMAAATWLGFIRRAAPGARIIYMEGNHEMRLPNAIIRNIVVAADVRPVNDQDGETLFSIPRILCLDDLDIEYMAGYPKNYLFLNENLLIEHGDISRAGSGDTSKAVLRDARISTYLAHIHKRESATKTVFSAKGQISYLVASAGCLCHIDGRVASKGSKNNWSQGIGKISYQDGNGLFADVPIAINDGRAIYNDEIYEWGVYYTEEAPPDCGASVTTFASSFF